MSRDILVVAEHLKGEIAGVTFELLGKARELAAASGGRVVAALAGRDAGRLAGALGAADLVAFVDHPALEDFNPSPWLAALEAILEKTAPRSILVGNTSMGMDLAAALSARRDLPLVAYATVVSPEGGDLVVTSQLYGGKICVESVLPAGSGIVSVLAGSFPLDPGRKEGSPALLEVPAPAGVEDRRVRFHSLIEPEGGDIDITRQAVLVCVGRGIQDAENIALAEELAAALGGAVCASRPVVDNQWLPKTRQVGKSGLKVKPRIYLALGVSGAPEHIEGMKDAELVIAVNTDRTAPIFDHAHYGTTEDLLEVVPALTQELK